MFTFVMVLNDECKIRITIHIVSTTEQLTMYFSWKWRTTTGTWMISLQFQIMSDDMTPRNRKLLDFDKHRHELFSTLADCSQTIHFCKDLMKREYGDGRIAFVLLLTGFDEAEKLKNQLLAKYGRKLSSLDYKSEEPVYPSYADNTSESEKEMAKFSRETKKHLYYRKEMSSDDCKHRDFKEHTTVYEKHVSMKKMNQLPRRKTTIAKYRREHSSSDYKNGERVDTSYADDTSESKKKMAKFSRETKKHLYYRKEMSSDDCKHRDFKEHTTVYEKHVSMKKMNQLPRRKTTIAKYRREHSSSDYKNGERVDTSYADDTSESKKKMAKFSRETKKHLYCRKEMSSDDCKHRGFKETRTVYEKHVSMKKMFQVLLFIVFCAQANAKPLPNQTLPKTMLYDLLSSPTCSSANLDMSDTCQTAKDLLKLLINDQCGFTCGPTDEPTCVNTQEGGSVYVCLPRNLTCEKGIRWVARRDKNDPDRVIVWEETCPDGTYQPYPSNCFDACLSKHQKTDNIPKQYVLFSRGNNTSPTLVYCNHLEGFYNIENKTLLDYDAEVLHDWFICQHVRDGNPCLEEEVLLSNGTCVEPCPPGICRDDHGMFICKLNCSSKERITERTSFGHRSDLTTTPRDFTTSSADNSGKHIDQKNDSPDNNVTVVVIAAVVSGIAGHILIGVIVLIIYSRRKDAKPKYLKKVSKKLCPEIILNSKGTMNIELNVQNKELENLLTKQTPREIEENTDEPKMEHLKSDEEERQNLQTGVVDSEETAVKKPY